MLYIHLQTEMQMVHLLQNHQTPANSLHDPWIFTSAFKSNIFKQTLSNSFNFRCNLQIVALIIFKMLSTKLKQNMKTAIAS